MAKRRDFKRVDTPEPKKPRWWIPKVWLGSGLAAWSRMLARNRCAVGPRFWHEALIYSSASVVNSTLGALQQALYGRRITRTRLSEPPLFIIGHWRTGTTFLHELLIQDQRHTFPNNYTCFAPHHFLLTEWIARRWFNFMMPSQRAMDNMPMAFERPQEDEFALCNLGIPSPYLTVAFPKRPGQYGEYFDLTSLSSKERERWKRVFLRFLKQLTIREPRRLVLKSPPHTCRIETLLELFPDARFVHIVRDPYVVFPSTVHLWKSLYATQGLQTPDLENLEENVLETFLMMHRRLDATRDLVKPGHFHELRYEDLVADPTGELERIYERLDLGDFDPARADVEKHLSSIKEYKTNRYRLDPRVRDEITERWGDQIRRFGYGVEPAVV